MSWPGNLDSASNSRSLFSPCLVAITGPSSGGIGAETAISLARAGPSQLVLLGRSQQRIQPVIDAIHAIDPSITVKFVPVDLSSVESSRQAAQVILSDASIPHIDVLINNAAVMACPFTKTVDNFELQLAAAHLGHFVLTNHLLPKLRASGHPRVISVSSMANKYSAVRFDDPNYTSRPSEYTAFGAYGQAKSANILFTLELNRRGVTAYALHPGGIMTNIGQHMTPEIQHEAAQAMAAAGQHVTRLKTLQQGCATTLRAALDRSLDEREGFWLVDCELSTDEAFIAPWALDQGNAKRCWEMSERLVGEKFDF